MPPLLAQQRRRPTLALARAPHLHLRLLLRGFSAHLVIFSLPARPVQMCHVAHQQLRCSG